MWRGHGRSFLSAIVLTCALVVGCSLFTSLDDLDGEPPPPSADGGSDVGSADTSEPVGPSDGSSDVTSGETGGPTSPYRAEVLADAPIVYLRFGEQPNSLNLRDEARPNVSGGTYPVSGVKLGVPGATADGDTAVEFQGGFITVTAGAELEGTQPCTIELWLKVNGPQQSDYEWILDHQRWSPARMGWDLMRSEGVFIFERTHPETPPSNLIGTAAKGAITAGTWHHVLASFDGTTQRIYLDGEVKEQSATGKGIGAIGTTWTIGGSNCTGCGNRFPFEGAVDEVAIYDKALGVDRIAAHIFAARLEAK